MASLLLHILDRLRRENLHGPTSPYPATRPALRKPHQHSVDSPDHDSWVLLDEEFGDLDAKDPRWFELFVEFFVEGGAEGNDDLLFFVRQGGSGPETTSADQQQQDPIFVRRKVANTMPSLGDLVDWKQTFFLNLIVQLPCTLTVAVCKRGASGERKRSLLAGEERIVVVGANSSGSGDSPATDATTPSPVGGGLVVDAESPATPSSPSPKSKPKMIAIQRIPKTVYAAPYKSRMDVKDAFMNECSYPLVYYTVNDYESHDLHLSIREKEYLCVELSVIIPDESKSDRVRKWTTTSGAEAVAAISLDDDSAPFPVPRGCAKIVLFQGAVPYTSLLDIYQQKGLAARNQLRLSWKKLTDGGIQGRKGNDSPPPERTEYIMMRGPHGKGQCQVAIKDDLPPPNIETEGSSSSSSRKPSSLTDKLFKMGSAVRTQLVAAAAASVLGVDSVGSDAEKLKKPESLRCSMTYVNVPWQSIISDLADHASRRSDKR
ncbi:uncharacterized protein SPPG_07015 [Spizellomyces punctatus DAOM BR117]|uniref:Uncharacterized protein n=1 Tax=Spizellomyces punctatus (strain DAOM BR117) TaxID=645134 RepID=A0A0L0H7M5_SPIPD|nr:uncharacterized protein SPPG_07015 [Spizellomyces punctatus DAOM BR117]KNC97540.1 hypothetical protein SPPG_07015 [Spizellomyces punctatus DAOM BR117]|eukprot:XP_016605580.1 hypothetical protein SPPG_07015 [Spizellomyces punctatus DAOM BR117]